jgi:LCP family protein required for cell wall assembly
VADPAAGPSRHRGRGRRTHGVLYVLISAATVLGLVVALGSVWFYRHLNDNLTTYDPSAQVTNTPNRIAPGDPINVLVMGSDTRAGEQTTAEMVDGGARSDTTILLHLSSDRKHAYGISIPRDTLVDRPDCRLPDGTVVPGERNIMFNTAFYVGGPACTIQTVQALTNIPIDHSVVVNFAGFKDMVDAIGGVDVCIPHAIDDDRYNMHLTAGPQVIRGNDALMYVRVRHGFGDGSDIGRMKRQQAFIASMAAKVVSAGTLTRLDHLAAFLNAATKSLLLDNGLDDVMKLARLGNQFREIGLDNIQFVTVPWEVYAPDHNRIVMKEPDADRLWARVRNDEPLSRSLRHEAISAGNTPGSPSSSPSSSPSGSASPSGTPSGGPSSSPTGSPAPDAQASAEAEANGLCA